MATTSARGGAPSAPRRRPTRESEPKSEPAAVAPSGGTHGDVPESGDGAATGRSSAVPDLVRLGWLVSRAYHDLPDRKTSAAHGLPTVSELGRDQQLEVALRVIDELVTTNVTAGAGAPLTIETAREAWAAAGTIEERTGKLREALDALNTQVLTDLSVRSEQLVTAYTTGRELADSCRVTGPTANDLAVSFKPARVAVLQANLANLSPALPTDSARSISRSLQHWVTWTAANSKAVGRESAAETYRPSLTAQSQVWRALLTGTADCRSLLTVDAWLAAADSSADTLSRAARHLARRFWLALLILAGAAGGLIYLSLTQAHGTAKVWTSLVTVAGTLGLTGASLRATAKRAASAVREQLVHAAEAEALGWAATVPAIREASRHGRPTRRHHRPGVMRGARSRPRAGASRGDEMNGRP